MIIIWNKGSSTHWRKGEDGEEAKGLCMWKRPQLQSLEDWVGGWTIDLHLQLLQLLHFVPWQPSYGYGERAEDQCDVTRWSKLEVAHQGGLYMYIIKIHVLILLNILCRRCTNLSCCRAKCDGDDTHDSFCKQAEISIFLWHQHQVASIPTGPGERIRKEIIPLL